MKLLFKLIFAGVLLSSPLLAQSGGSAGVILNVNRAGNGGQSVVSDTGAGFGYQEGCRAIYSAHACNQTEGCAYEYSSHRCNEIPAPQPAPSCATFDMERSLCLEQPDCEYDMPSGACYPY